MNKNRVFTDKELKQMTKQTRELAIEAIKAGDEAMSEELVNHMYDESVKILDAYMNWVADLLDYVYTVYGVDSLEKALRKHQERTEGRKIELYRKMDFRTRVQTHTTYLRGLFQKLEIEEDDEKVSIKMNPCGTGQRLLESGAYDPPRNLSRMKPHATTFSTNDFPIYCAHGAMQEILSIETVGYPLYVHWFPAEMATESCTFCFYKNPESIPEEVYTRVGKKKNT